MTISRISLTFQISQDEQKWFITFLAGLCVLCWNVNAFLRLWNIFTHISYKINDSFLLNRPKMEARVCKSGVSRFLLLSQFLSVQII